MDTLEDITIAKRLQDGDGAWKEVILSLDGGGIRSYSSLLIVQALAKYVAKEEQTQDGVTANADDHIPLPAYYFDYVAGTGTGGLIALMLGRLRMTTKDSLKAFSHLMSTVFSSVKIFSRSDFSSADLKSALLEIIQKNCLDHDDTRPPENRQLAEPDLERNRCRVAVLTARLNKPKGDQLHLFRTYFYPGFTISIDPHAHLTNLENDSHTILMWEAAYASLAVPQYFESIFINGIEFMDGGLRNSNPSPMIFREAKYLHNYRPIWQRHIEDENATGIGLLVSIGAGHWAPLSLFSKRDFLRRILHLGKVSVSHLADSEQTHVQMKDVATRLRIPYFRFNVPSGLEKVRLKDGRTRTLKKIAAVTEEYLNMDETKDEMKRCAKLIVAHRRGRCRSAREKFFWDKEFHNPGPARTYRSDSTSETGPVVGLASGFFPRMSTLSETGGARRSYSIDAYSMVSI